MLFPQTVLQSILALYGFGERGPARRGPAPIHIGQPRTSRLN
jgi:hypothetical protein